MTTAKRSRTLWRHYVSRLPISLSSEAYVDRAAATLNEQASLSLASHALSPLLTAITTRRLEQPYATALGTALCKHQQLKVSHQRAFP